MSNGVIHSCGHIALFSPVSWGTFLFWYLCEIPKANPALLLTLALHCWESPWMLLYLNLNSFCSWNPGAIFVLTVVWHMRECVILCIVTFIFRLELCDNMHVENGFWIHHHLRLRNYKTDWSSTVLMEELSMK